MTDHLTEAFANSLVDDPAVWRLEPFLPLPVAVLPADEAVALLLRLKDMAWEEGVSPALLYRALAVRAADLPFAPGARLVEVALNIETTVGLLSLLDTGGDLVALPEGRTATYARLKQGTVSLTTPDAVAAYAAYLVANATPPRGSRLRVLGDPPTVRQTRPDGSTTVGMTVLHNTTLYRIEAEVDAGGRVDLCGSTPTLTDASYAPERREGRYRVRSGAIGR